MKNKKTTYGSNLCVTSCAQGKRNIAREGKANANTEASTFKFAECTIEGIRMDKTGIVGKEDSFAKVRL
jgi:hypothetical protein